jgi:Icc-related predicted phosphoesterase
MLKLSEKVKAYVEEVEKETGYNVSIESVDHIGVAGSDIAMTLDRKNKYIRIQVDEKKFIKNSEEESEEEFKENTDSAIAHEVTHGLLTLKKKYCGLTFRPLCSEEEKGIVNTLVTMIEDIPVNKIIHEKENYQLYPNCYIKTTKNDTKSIRDIRKGKGKDSHREEPMNKKDMAGMVFGYIQAWGYLEYFNLDKINKKHKNIICRFIKEFKKVCPKNYEEAKKVKEIIRKNDIFTPEGYNNAIKKCLDLWNLKNLVDIYIC